MALEYDPIAQGQTNSDKRKSDGVFGCVLDDRPDVGLEIASGMIDRSEKVLVYSAALAVGSSGSLESFSWLIDDLKKSYTIVIVTHSMAQAVRVSQKTGFFHLGKIIEVDSTDKIFKNPANKMTQDYITGRFG